VGAIRTGTVDSDSEGDAPAPARAPAASTVGAIRTGTVDSDSEGDAPAPARAPAATAVGAIRTGTVDSDSEGDAPAPARAPAPASAGTGGGGGVFDEVDSGSDSDSGLSLPSSKASGSQGKGKSAAAPRGQPAAAQHGDDDDAIGSVRSGAGGDTSDDDSDDDGAAPKKAPFAAKVTAGGDATVPKRPVGQCAVALPRALAAYKGIGAVDAPEESRSDLLSVRFGVFEDQGTRKSMEDRCMAVIDMNMSLDLPAGAPPMAWFGVYDGHNGEACSDYLQRRLHRNISKMVGFLDDPVQAMVRGFVKSDDVFQAQEIKEEAARQDDIARANAAGQKAPDPFVFSGSTAVAVLARAEILTRAEARDDSTIGSEDFDEEEEYSAPFLGTEEEAAAGLAAGKLVRALRTWVTPAPCCRMRALRLT